MSKCADCNGTGEYQGLNSVESCKTCGGSGEVFDLRGEALTPEMIQSGAEAMLNAYAKPLDDLSSFGGPGPLEDKVIP